jgi:hypothetical protein
VALEAAQRGRNHQGVGSMAQVYPSSQDLKGEPSKADEVQAPHSESSGIQADRERIMNDLTNTGVIAALMGGFALSSMQLDLNGYGAGANATTEMYRQLGSLFWLVAFAAAHLWFVSMSIPYTRVSYLCGLARVLTERNVTYGSTLSAAASALLYRKINMLEEDQVGIWLQQNRRLYKIPYASFLVGTKMYEIDIVLFGLLFYNGQTGWMIVRYQLFFRFLVFAAGWLQLLQSKHAAFMRRPVTCARVRVCLPVCQWSTVQLWA